MYFTASASELHMQIVSNYRIDPMHKTSNKTLQWALKIENTVTTRDRMSNHNLFFPKVTIQSYLNNIFRP